MADPTFDRSAVTVEPPDSRPPTRPEGLTAAEVADRVARGEVNDAGERTSRTLVEIVRANVFTRFNAILGTMLALILVFGSPADGLFGIVIVINAAIGIVQELLAKRKLDELAVLSAPVARAVREGEVEDIPVETLVLDDLLELRTGDQVPADGTITESVGLELDESLLTGEADAIAKSVGGSALSGSFVVAGSGRMQATAIGADAYARKLAADARRFTVTRSELVDGVNLILRYVTWLILFVGPVLFWRELRDGDVPSAITGAVAGVVGMVPEGLVLLTSIAFGVAVIVLGRRNVLVQELPAVEGLARVDVVCLDKTGTLTEGSIAFDHIQPLGAHAEAEAEAVLGALAADANANATFEALSSQFGDPGWTRTDTVPFSSARKWSAAQFADHGSWVVGAPEMVWPDHKSTVRQLADEVAATGSRTLLLTHTDAPLQGEVLPEGLDPVALVMFAEQVRPDAAETLDYFRSQGVLLKVISGDNPRTVGAVARRVGLDVGEPVDARSLPEDEAGLADALEAHSVFGRVTPQQKRAMVGALQSRGHVVAMTGDGVNDALALKDADIGVAMGSGAAATRAVAQLVLLDGKFATLPGVVAEGRRVVANIERSANLFLVKTIYAALFSLATVFTGWPYPFLPRHFTVISALTIGIPGFFLALAPNTRRYVPGFVKRVLRFAIPTGAIAAIAVYTAYAVARSEDVSSVQARTTAFITLLIVALFVLVVLARPLTAFRSALVFSMIGGAVAVFAIPPLRDLVNLKIPSTDLLTIAFGCAAAACVLIEFSGRIRGSRFVAGDDEPGPASNVPAIP
ncbi:MAG: HAD-IC family P-type ATPase [Acidimicrobiia bacterium]|nr:HAD-IC family P-type ATPase [Acidimicrobiia bacterium]